MYNDEKATTDIKSGIRENNQERLLKIELKFSKVLGYGNYRS